MQDGSGQEELLTRNFTCYEENRAADVRTQLTGESVLVCRRFSTKKLNKDEISQLYLLMLKMLVFKHRV